MARNVQLAIALCLSAWLGTALGSSRSKEPTVFNEVLEILGDQGATILFAYASDCPYCKKQEPMLKSLDEQTGIDVRPVSLDGRATPLGLFEDFDYDRKLLMRLKVQATPTLFMGLGADGTRQLTPLSEGLVSANELKRAILQVAKKRGWVTGNKIRRHRREQKQAEQRSESNPDSTPEARISGQADDHDDPFAGALRRHQNRGLTQQ